ncbi:MAG: M67 family metallopeptidase [Gemmatimonadota bacterium]
MKEERSREVAERRINLILSRHILAKIRAHVEGAYPEEACGGLLGLVRDERAIEVADAVSLANAREEERRRRYLIGPGAVVELERRAEAANVQVVGYYHSHPDAAPVPSAFDREHAWPWYIYLIVSVENGRMARAEAWRLADDRRGFISLLVGDENRATIGTQDR